jgi:hypothetical protein
VLRQLDVQLRSVHQLTRQEYKVTQLDVGDKNTHKTEQKEKPFYNSIKP